MTFLNSEYLLSNTTAMQLYDKIKDLPIIDAHNHADIKEIYENKNYDDIWHVECATDHYVWEVLRKRGVDEKYITGNASNYEKWMELSHIFDETVGNPVYEWVHLDLRRRFSIYDRINAETGQQIWDKTKELLAKNQMRPRNLLKAMNIHVMCTTDDPIDSLEYHQKLNDIPEMTNMIRPTFRPDKAMNIFKPDWKKYINKLAKRVNSDILSIEDLVDALQQTHDFFAEHGCHASDHGVETPYAYNTSEKTANDAFQTAIKDKKITKKQEIAFCSYILNKLAEMDMKKGWVFQLHIGAVRDVRDSISNNIGADAGGDISNHTTDIVTPLKDLLNNVDNSLEIILYCLEPHHQATLATLSRAFGEKVSLGSVWWLNDTPVGMKRQLEYICSVDVLMNFAGMVSDSRKILSYGSRTEMFRRVLADVIGKMVEQGQIPLDLAEKTVTYLSYKRQKELFNFCDI
ncbi:MAG: glucuronate isomerase [Verrucomicrobiota bacterium]|nr:glucuronate isomerase [Verrucomicrobiota bacterium]